MNKISIYKDVNSNEKIKIIENFIFFLTDKYNLYKNKSIEFKYEGEWKYSQKREKGSIIYERNIEKSMYSSTLIWSKHGFKHGINEVWIEGIKICESYWVHGSPHGVYKKYNMNGDVILNRIYSKGSIIKYIK